MELCHLISAFKPKDIWPCTVDKANWSAAQSMSFLFGHLYDSPCKFTHDQAMFRKKGGDAGVVLESKPGTPGDRTKQQTENDVDRERGACSSLSEASLQLLPNATTAHTRLGDHTELADDHNTASTDRTFKKRRRSDDESKVEQAAPSAKEERIVVDTGARPADELQMPSKASHVNPPSLSPYEYSEAWKQQAFEAAQGTGPSNWNDITLVSVSGHQEREEEL